MSVWLRQEHEMKYQCFLKGDILSQGILLKKGQGKHWSEPWPDRSTWTASARNILIGMGI